MNLPDAADWGDLKMKLACQYKLENASAVTVKAEFKNADGKVQTPIAVKTGNKKGSFQELSFEFWVKSGVRSGRLILSAQNGSAVIRDLEITHSELAEKELAQLVANSVTSVEPGLIDAPQPTAKVKAIREKGIEIVKFDPIKFPWINHVFHRDHRKIVVIDGTIGYTGGMNIADYYINGLPEIGEWRDMHVRIEGEAVSHLQDIFLDMWNKCTKQDIGGNAYYPYRTSSSAVPSEENEVAIVDRYPKKNAKTMRRVYAKAIESAERNVQIINPYFTPTRIIKKAIKKAVEKGVNVEIMIPGKSDIKFTPDAALYIANQLRKKGANIYIYNGGFHHSKIMMIDSTYCTVGSTNLNSRSLHYDYEVNAFIFDKETTDELITMFKEDQEDSTLLTAEIYKKRSLWKKFVGWFAHLLTPFL